MRQTKFRSLSKALIFRPGCIFKVSWRALKKKKSVEPCPGAVSSVSGAESRHWYSLKTRWGFCPVAGAGNLCSASFHPSSQWLHGFPHPLTHFQLILWNLITVLTELILDTAPSVIGTLSKVLGIKFRKQLKAFKFLPVMRYGRFWSVLPQCWYKL